MRVLVTGGTGFLGKALACRLLSDGHVVTVIGRNEVKGKALAELGILYQRVDLADASTVAASCQNQDYVVHCGALSSPWGKYDAFYESNVIGTKHVIQGCRQHNVKRLIHVSTPSIYMEYRDRYLIKENDPLPAKAVNLYAETKLMAEKIVDAAVTDGLPVITIRPRGIFGPGDYTIFPRLIKINNTQGIPDFGKKVIVDITYIDNVVDALILCMQAPEKFIGKKYNITNGEPQELKKFLERLFAKLAQPLRLRRISYQMAYGAAMFSEFYAKFIPGAAEPKITRYGVGVLYYSQTLDISAAQQDLGYSPRCSLHEGLEQFVAWRRQK